MTTKSAAPRSSTKSASTKKPSKQSAIVQHSVETLEIDGADAALADLINSLNAPDEVMAASTPIAEAVEAKTDLSDFHSAMGVADDEVISSTMLADAVSGAEAVEASIAAATSTVIEGSEVPTGDASDVVAEAPVVALKEKKVAVPRKHYTDKTERLKDKLGAGLSEYSVLTLADAAVSDEELVAVMENTMQIIRNLNKKEQNWAVKFIEYMAGKKSSLSEVTARILNLLNKDGFITMGAEGNVFKDLVSKPYSPGAARAMGGNNVGMLKDLKVIIDGEVKGKYIANPESLLLMKVQSMMSAPAVAVPAAA